MRVYGNKACGWEAKWEEGFGLRGNNTSMIISCVSMSFLCLCDMLCGRRFLPGRVDSEVTQIIESRLESLDTINNTALIS